MERKPTVAAGYSPAAVQLVQAASLYIATKLGDLRDDFVIVGGLVPSLIVPTDRTCPQESRFTSARWMLISAWRLPSSMNSDTTSFVNACGVPAFSPTQTRPVDPPINAGGSNPKAIR